ncbi:MAG: ABC transporter permease [Gemmatimonadaceae bacterium]
MAVCLAALVVAVGIAARGRQTALDEIRRMGATVLVVSAEDSRNRAGRARTGAPVTTLTLRDARMLEADVPGILVIAGEYRFTLPVTVNDLARQATVAGSVRERRFEIGTRRALGATRGMIFAQFAIEAGVVGAAGALCGVASGLGVARFARLPVSGAFALGSAVTVFIATQVAAAWPSWRAALQSPASVLRAP